MDASKKYNACNTLLSEVATEISQALSNRGDLVGLYLGQTSGEVQLELFRPILLEACIALLTGLEEKKEAELRQTLLQDTIALASDLGLEGEKLVKTRLSGYAKEEDRAELFVALCHEIVLTNVNAPANAVEEKEKPELNNRGYLELVQGFQRLMEFSSQT